MESNMNTRKEENHKNKISHISTSFEIGEKIPFNISVSVNPEIVNSREPEPVTERQKISSCEMENRRSPNQKTDPPIFSPTALLETQVQVCELKNYGSPSSSQETDFFKSKKAVTTLFSIANQNASDICQNIQSSIETDSSKTKTNTTFSYDPKPVFDENGRSKMSVMESNSSINQEKDYTRIIEKSGSFFTDQETNKSCIDSSLICQKIYSIKIEKSELCQVDAKPVFQGTEKQEKNPGELRIKASPSSNQEIDLLRRMSLSTNQDTPLSEVKERPSSSISPNMKLIEMQSLIQTASFETEKSPLLVFEEPQRRKTDSCKMEYRRPLSHPPIFFPTALLETQVQVCELKNNGSPSSSQETLTEKALKIRNNDEKNHLPIKVSGCISQDKYSLDLIKTSVSTCRNKDFQKITPRETIDPEPHDIFKADSNDTENKSVFSCRTKQKNKKLLTIEEENILNSLRLCQEVDSNRLKEKRNTLLMQESKFGKIKIDPVITEETDGRLKNQEILKETSHIKGVVSCESQSQCLIEQENREKMDPFRSCVVLLERIKIPEGQQMCIYPDSFDVDTNLLRVVREEYEYQNIKTDTLLKSERPKVPKKGRLTKKQNQKKVLILQKTKSQERKKRLMSKINLKTLVQDSVYKIDKNNLTERQDIFEVVNKEKLHPQNVESKRGRPRKSKTENAPVASLTTRLLDSVKTDRNKNLNKRPDISKIDNKEKLHIQKFERIGGKLRKRKIENSSGTRAKIRKIDKTNLRERQDISEVVNKEKLHPQKVERKRNRPRKSKTENAPVASLTSLLLDSVKTYRNKNLNKRQDISKIDNKEKLNIQKIERIGGKLRKTKIEDSLWTRTKIRKLETPPEKKESTLIEKDCQSLEDQKENWKECSKDEDPTYVLDKKRMNEEAYLPKSKSEFQNGPSIEYLMTKIANPRYCYPCNSFVSEGTSLHWLPEFHFARRKKWLDYCATIPTCPTVLTLTDYMSEHFKRNVKLCSKHFEKQMYSENNKLYPHAVPSVKLPVKSFNDKTTQTRRSNTSPKKPQIDIDSKAIKEEEQEIASKNKIIKLMKIATLASENVFSKTNVNHLSTTPNIIRKKKGLPGAQIASTIFVPEAQMLPSVPEAYCFLCGDQRRIKALFKFPTDGYRLKLWIHYAAKLVGSHTVNYKDYFIKFHDKLAFCYKHYKILNSKCENYLMRSEKMYKNVVLHDHLYHNDSSDCSYIKKDSNKSSFNIRIQTVNKIEETDAKEVPSIQKPGNSKNVLHIPQYRSDQNTHTDKSNRKQNEIDRFMEKPYLKQDTPIKTIFYTKNPKFLNSQRHGIDISQHSICVDTNSLKAKVQKEQSYNNEKTKVMLLSSEDSPLQTVNKIVMHIEKQKVPNTQNLPSSQNGTSKNNQTEIYSRKPDETNPLMEKKYDKGDIQMKIVSIKEPWPLNNKEHGTNNSHLNSIKVPTDKHIPDSAHTVLAQANIPSSDLPGSYYIFHKSGLTEGYTKKNDSFINCSATASKCITTKRQGNDICSLNKYTKPVKEYTNKSHKKGQNKLEAAEYQFEERLSDYEDIFETDDNLDVKSCGTKNGTEHHEENDTSQDIRNINTTPKIEQIVNFLEVENDSRVEICDKDGESEENSTVHQWEPVDISGISFQFKEILSDYEDTEIISETDNGNLVLENNNKTKSAELKENSSVIQSEPDDIFDTSFECEERLSDYEEIENNVEVEEQILIPSKPAQPDSTSLLYSLLTREHFAGFKSNLSSSSTTQDLNNPGHNLISSKPNLTSSQQENSSEHMLEDYMEEVIFSDDEELSEDRVDEISKKEIPQIINSKCVVPNCPGSKRSFKVPEKTEYLWIWRGSLRFPNLKVGDSVCDRHFHPSSIASCQTGIKVLKAHTVPCEDVILGCCVSGCINANENTNIMLHIPCWKRTAVITHWLELIQNPEIKFSTHKDLLRYRVCEIHFDPNDLRRNTYDRVYPTRHLPISKSTEARLKQYCLKRDMLLRSKDFIAKLQPKFTVTKTVHTGCKQEPPDSDEFYSSCALNGCAEATKSTAPDKIYFKIPSDN